MDKDAILTSIKVAAGAVAALWGGLEAMVQLLIALMILDIATGLLAGYISKELSSDVSFRGMAKKAIALLLVAGGQLLEPTVGLPLSEAIAGFYAMHELLSVLENAARAGLPVPQILKDALAKLNMTPISQVEEKR